MESEPTTPDAHSTMSAYHESNIQFLRSSAREWLEAVLEENLDKQTTLEDLLADGTLLFRVAQHLKDDHKYPGHVESPSMASPSFDRKSSLKYQPYASVEDFLKVCKEVGLRDVDVFNPSDAVDQKDIRRVCVCLRRLSKKARTLHLAVPDFDNVKETLVTKMPRETVQKTKETLQQSASRSSSRLSNENGQTVSSETSSSITDLRKDDPEPEPVQVESDTPDFRDTESESPQPEPVNVESDTSDFRDTESEAMAETFNKVHHDVAAEHKEPVVTDSKYTVKVAEPGVDTLPLASDHAQDLVDRNISSKSTGGDSKVISEAPPAPKVVSEAPPALKPTMSRIMLKPPGEVKAPVEQLAKAVSEESQKGLFKAHLQGTAPYIKKEVKKKEVKKEKPKKDDNSPWLLPVLAGAVAIAGGILGLTLWKKRDSDQSPMAGFIGSGKMKLMKLRNHIDHSSDSDSSSDSESDDDEAPKLKFFHSSGGVYEVKDGDNLTKIAKRSGKKHWREIADKNPSIGNPDLIYPGDRLKL